MTGDRRSDDSTRSPRWKASKALDALQVVGLFDAFLSRSARAKCNWRLFFSEIQL